MVESLGRRSTALALVVLLVFWTRSALADPRAEARRHFQDGMSLIRDGKYEAGTRELYEAYRIVPHPAVLYNLGRAFFEAGQYDRAIEELERYVGSDPSDRAEAERLIDIARERLRLQRPFEGEPRRSQEDDRDESSRPRDQSGVQEELAQMREQLKQVRERMETLQSTGRPSPSGGSAQARPGTAATTGTPEISGGAAPPGPALPADVDVTNGGASSLDDPYAPIVITSSRYGQNTLDAPNSVTILTGDELRASGVTSIPDFLRRVPGVEVMALGAGDFNIGIRGFNDRLSNKVLVLIDGRSTYFDHVGATFWSLLPIAPADVERIEVVRGPGAALYGANAFSGVINIITRNPGQGDEPTVHMWGGFPDQGGASLRLTNRVGATAYSASFSVERKLRPYRQLDESSVEYELLAPHPNDAVRVGRADLRLDHRFGRRSSVSVSGGIAGGQTQFGATGTLNELYVDGYQGYLRGDLALPYGISIRSFWNHTDFRTDQWARPVGGLDVASRPITDVIDVEAQSLREIDFGVVQRLNIGAGYRFKAADWNYLGSDPEEHHVSVFFQDEAILTDSLRATLSLRLDRHPLLANIEGAALTDRYAFSPRGALVWRVAPGHSVHATVGTAFRTPTFLESYISSPFPTTNDAVVVRNVGNLALLPERVLSSEVGWRSEPASSRYRLEAAAYFNRISSLIQVSDLQPWPEGESNYDPEAGVWYVGDATYVNLDEDYSALGFEFGGTIYPVDGVDLYGSATYEKIDQGGESIRSTSPLKLSTGAQLRLQDFTVTGDLHYVSAQTWPLRGVDDGGPTMFVDIDLPSYLWAGARVAYRIPDTRLELAVAGQNLLASLQSAVTAAEGDGTQVTTPSGSHREHPLGQPIPLSVQASLTYRLW
jgi:iron complex outermembrane recepter protein